MPIQRRPAQALDQEEMESYADDNYGRTKRTTIDFDAQKIKASKPSAGTQTFVRRTKSTPGSTQTFYTEKPVDKPARKKPDAKKTTKDVEYVLSANFDYQDGVRMIFEGLQADINYKRATDQGILFQSNQDMIEFNRNIRDEYLERERKTRLKETARRIRRARGQARVKAAAQGVRVDEGSVGAIDADIIQAGMEAQEEINNQMFMNKLQNWQQSERAISQNIMERQIRMLDAKTKYRAELFNIVQKRINLTMKPVEVKKTDVVGKSTPATYEEQVGVPVTEAQLKAEIQEARAKGDNKTVKLKMDQYAKAEEEVLQKVQELEKEGKDEEAAEALTAFYGEGQRDGNYVEPGGQPSVRRTRRGRGRTTEAPDVMTGYFGSEGGGNYYGETEGEPSEEDLLNNEVSVVKDAGELGEGSLADQTGGITRSDDDFARGYFIQEFPDYVDTSKKGDDFYNFAARNLGKKWVSSVDNRPALNDEVVEFYDELKELKGKSLTFKKFSKMMTEGMPKKTQTQAIKQLKQIFKEAVARGRLDSEDMDVYKFPEKVQDRVYPDVEGDY